MWIQQIRNYKEEEEALEKKDDLWFLLVLYQLKLDRIKQTQPFEYLIGRRWTVAFLIGR